MRDLEIRVQTAETELEANRDLYEDLEGQIAEVQAQS